MIPHTRIAVRVFEHNQHRRVDALAKVRAMPDDGIIPRIARLTETTFGVAYVDPKMLSSSNAQPRGKNVLWTCESEESLDRPLNKEPFVVISTGRDMFFDLRPVRASSAP